MEFKLFGTDKSKSYLDLLGEMANESQGAKNFMLVMFIFFHSTMFLRWILLGFLISFGWRLGQ